MKIISTNTKKRPELNMFQMKENKETLSYYCSNLVPQFYISQIFGNVLHTLQDF